MIATATNYGVTYSANVSRWLVLNSYSQGTMSHADAKREAKRRNVENIKPTVAETY